MKLLWANLAAWFVQVTIVASCGSVLPALFRVRSSVARFWYWRILLFTCILLPLIEPWPSAPAVSGRVTFTMGPVVAVGVSGPPGLAFSWTLAGIAILLAGAAARLLRLVSGLVRLRRYGARASALEPIEDAVGELRRLIAPRAEISISGEVSGPVTFGLRTPMILLPEKFPGLTLSARVAIVCHELVHVRRRDWAVALAEEALRSVVWFHPAIWWVMAQIQLTREQVVDEEVVEITGDREGYLDALLTVASLRFSADLAPAPLFLKKRHLRQRVESMVMGVTMTKRNLLLAMAAALAALPVLVGVAAWQFPLRAAPQEAVDDAGVEIQAGSLKILHRTGIVYPDEARAKHVSGTVVANVTVNEKGEVTDAAAVSGPQELRKAVVQSLLNWHFSSDSTGPAATLQIAVRFNAGLSSPVVEPPGVIGAGGTEDVPRTIDLISIEGLPPVLRERVVESGLVHVGDVMTRESFKAVESSLRQLDEHLRMTGVLHNDKMTVLVRLQAPAAARVSASAFSASSTGDASQEVRVGGAVQSANLITKVNPVYPALAKLSRVQGVVRFDAAIGKDGTIKNLQLVSGHPILVQAAMEAVRQWIYKPTLLNGNPVDVRTTIDVNFTLLDIPPENTPQ